MNNCNQSWRILNLAASAAMLDSQELLKDNFWVVFRRAKWHISRVLKSCAHASENATELWVPLEYFIFLISNFLFQIFILCIFVFFYFFAVFHFLFMCIVTCLSVYVCVCVSSYFRLFFLSFFWVLPKVLSQQPRLCWHRNNRRLAGSTQETYRRYRVKERREMSSKVLCGGLSWPKEPTMSRMLLAALFLLLFTLLLLLRVCSCCCSTFSKDNKNNKNCCCCCYF